MQDDYLKNTRETLIRVMNEKSLSQREVARKCNLHRNEVAYILNGEKRDLKLSTISSIAEGLGLPISKVIGERPQANAESNQFILKLYATLGEYIKEIKGTAAV